MRVSLKAIALSSAILWGGAMLLVGPDSHGRAVVRRRFSADHEFGGPGRRYRADAGARSARHAVRVHRRRCGRLDLRLALSFSRHGPESDLEVMKAGGARSRFRTGGGQPERLSHQRRQRFARCGAPPGRPRTAPARRLKIASCLYRDAACSPPPPALCLCWGKPRRGPSKSSSRADIRETRSAAAAARSRATRPWDTM